MVLRDELKALAGAADGHRLSLCMPTVRRGQETRQNRIRYKNLLERLEHAASAVSLTTAAASRLAEARDLIDNDAFWQHQGDGLAMYIGSDDAWIYQLSGPMDDVAVAGRHFHLKPLLAHLDGVGLFAIVVVSMGELHVLDCGPDGWVEIQSAELPSGMQVIARYLDAERQLQVHTGLTAAGAEGGAQQGMYHGQGARKDDAKVRIREYFAQVDKALGRMLPYRRPVIFAGVEYLFPIFRDATSSINLLDDRIHGNSDDVRADFDDVYEQGRSIIARRAARSLDAVLERFGEASAAGRSSSDLDVVLTAARDGRVGTLLMNPRASIWGDLENEGAVQHAAGDGGEDLINAASVLTFAHGGDVIAIDDPARLPDRSPVAAIFRY
jgi:hypothetical protein